MAIKLEIKNLYKIFGEHPHRAFKYIEKGLNKAQILEKTGLSLGVKDASLAIEEGDAGFYIRLFEKFLQFGIRVGFLDTLIRFGEFDFEALEILFFHQIIAETAYSPHIGLNGSGALAATSA